MRTAIVAVMISSLLAACAPVSGDAEPSASGTRAERQCFNISEVDNFRQGRISEVYLKVGRNDVYQLDAAGGCNDLDFAYRLAILPDGAGLSGSRLCTDDWARLVVPGSTTPASVCRVRISKRLTTEEVAALPAAYKP
ncbi:MAG: hypothetical protein JHC81_08530 [Brevundimonas sp.]|uniref:DUF6491 family protein n=1 Tax=Brevundimonas sp. TaxID=1871086 RepID=UPI001A1FAD75|nr:DUF6491 family protein [Brevundimonas sp.]MBJ7447567.1 hypothetical protein [Brevundimonas sp.]